MIRHGSRGDHVRWVQRALNATVLNEAPPLAVDGHYGPATEQAVRLFQSQAGLLVDGIVGPATRAALQDWDTGPRRLTPDDASNAAAILRVDLPAVQAIMAIESRGNGFLPSGSPVILFERHVMRRRALHHGVPQDTVSDLMSRHPDLVNTATGGYVGGEPEHVRLARASEIHRIAALESASWGLFQIMGFHSARLGYGNAERFVEAMSRSEQDHLEAFVRFIEADAILHRALRDHDWDIVAERYNGRGYAAHGYHIRLREFYRRAANA